MLAHLRNGDTYIQLAAGFGVGMATGYRHLREAVDLLAAQAPSLTAARWARAATFTTFAIPDETVVRIDRLGRANNRRCYPGKHRPAGVNLQRLTDPYTG